MVAARRDRGFTLVEMMVVIALVGVLTALAVSSNEERGRPFDGAQVTAAMVREAARRAVLVGSLSSDSLDAVRVSEGPDSDEFKGYRTRVAVSELSNGRVSVVVEHLIEPGTSNDWRVFSETVLDRGITYAGFSDQAELTDGSTPEFTGAPAIFECNFDSTCKGRTIYFEGGGRRARVVVLPLGGSPETYNTW